MNETNQLHVPEAGRPLNNFRDDLREPVFAFGRCALTGQFAPCACIDLGDFAYEVPNTDEGVEIDPITQKVTFTKSRPAVFHSQLSVSKEGLELISRWMENQDSPIPIVAPTLVYGWEVLYSDGSIYTQFMFDREGREVENNSRNIDYSRVNQVTIRPRDPSLNLPTITYSATSGQFFENGEEIDSDYDGEFIPSAKVVCARKVTHTSGSFGTPGSMSRTIENVHTTVLYLLGWHEGGVDGIERPHEGKHNIIAVDERGNWRPWRQA